MRGLLTLTVLILASLAVLVSAGQPKAKFRPLPDLREQDRLERTWVQKRHEAIPGILQKHGYDAWIMTQREYAEDTVFRALVSTTSTFSARRRTVFVFHTHPNITSPFHYVSMKEDLWGALNGVLGEIDPKKIAVNIDRDSAFSDGLHTGEGQQLVAKLDPKWRSRISSDRALGVETIALRAGGKEQLEMYRLLQENVWAMIAEGFSKKTIEIGKTTATDLEWWFRDCMRWRIGTGTWFPPSVTIHRHPDEPSKDDHPQMRLGDMLHVDIGITAMGMNTDTQHLGYILRSNETAPPASLISGLHDANKLQDMVRSEMIPGRIGDDVFFNVTHRMEKAGLKGLIYSHPIGDYGHSAGAIIGMQDWQDAIPGGGSNPVLKDYWTSVELAGSTFVPEWNRVQDFELEEDVYWNDESGTFEWVYGQQTEFHLVRPKIGKHGSFFSSLAKSMGWNVARWL